MEQKVCSVAIIIIKSYVHMYVLYYLDMRKFDEIAIGDFDQKIMIGHFYALINLHS